MDNEKIAKELVAVAREIMAGGIEYYRVNYTYEDGDIWLSILFAKKSSIAKWDKANPEREIQKITKVRSPNGFIVVPSSEREYTDVGDDFKLLGSFRSLTESAYAPKSGYSNGKKDYDAKMKEIAQQESSHYRKPWV